VSINAQVEMLGPVLLTRMEEVDPLLTQRVNTTDIGSFVKIALGTCPGQVVDFIVGLMNLGNDVVKMEWPHVGTLWETAVLAASVCTHLDESASGFAEH
jgi:hypothetical protein